MKTCRTCGIAKDETDFYMHDKDRRKPDCKDCVKDKQRERYSNNEAARQRAIDNAARYQRENPEKVKEWRRRNKPRQDLKFLYGLSIPAWEALLMGQQGRCQICAEPMLKPCVDHCHATGAVRGLLCRDCNTGLGLFKDDVDRLRAALDYLQKDRATLSP